jgi:hypothetical protein
MSLQYVVGIRIGSKPDQIAIEAEDALIAALRVKAAHPEAAITYVRKQNARGDQRHPHPRQADKAPAEPEGG